MSQEKITAKLDLPTSWRHGKGLANEVGSFVEMLECKHPLVLTDKILLSSGVLKPILSSLEAKGMAYTICDGVNKEPTLELLEDLLQSLDLNSFDIIVAVGGGSVLDVSKALAIIASFGGNIKDYAGHEKVPGVPTTKVIAVPTTSGTGSEISDGIVLIDEEQNTKFLVLSKKICPTMAVTDPLMTLSMPARVTACSGMDALVHATESYISKNSNVVTELFSLKAVELLSKNIRTACVKGDDIKIRENMQMGATIAMMAGMNAYLGLCHAMAMPLCALYKMPHGQACGMLLPHVLEYNAAVAEQKISKVLDTMGIGESHQNLSQRLEEINFLLTEIGLFAKLRDFDYRPEHMQIIVNATLGSAQCPTNPREPLKQDIAEIINKMI